MLRRMLFVGVVGLIALFSAAVGQTPEKREIRPDLPPTARRVSSEAVEQAREAVELVEAELDLKRAHVAAAQVGVKSSEKQLQLGLKAGAAISDAERTLLSFDHERAVAELRIKEAEMKIGEIKLQHARRKLARLEPQPKPKEDK